MNKQQWESSLAFYPEHNFLQSWAWGEFHQKLGHPVYRIHEKNWMFQAIVEPATRARYLTVPGGPLLSNYSSLSLWKQSVLLMKEIAIKENCVFIRIRPQILDDEIATGCPGRYIPRNDILRILGFRPAPMHLHAELTRVLDLTKTDEELLSEMRKSTRYEIRRAQKLGIKVEQSSDERLIEEFIKLQNETAEREHFVPFSKLFLLEQFRAFKKDDAVRWFYVERNSNGDVLRSDLEYSRSDLHTIQEIISMAFVIFYHHEAVYHYAASARAAREIPAAYALQWAIIQEAKKHGCTTYNLWGDVPDDKLSSHRFPTYHSAHRFAVYHSAHRFAGPSLFKRGFGGRQVAYLHAHDFPLSKRYWINWIIEEIRKYGRGLD